MNPDLILSGWDGSTTPVTARFDDNSNDDGLTVIDPSDSSVLSGLGAIQLIGDYCGGTDALHRLTDDPQRQHGDDRARHGLRHTRRDTSAKDMVWWTYQGIGDRVGPLGPELLTLVLGSSKPVSTPIRDR